MIEALIAWDGEDDPDGNVQHMADNDVTPEEATDVLRSRDSYHGFSRSSGLPLTIGRTPAGRQIALVWEVVLEEPLVIHPITAFEPKPK